MRAYEIIEKRLGDVEKRMESGMSLQRETLVRWLFQWHTHPHTFSTPSDLSPIHIYICVCMCVYEV